MTLEERLCLARAGYSAQDIAQFEQGANFAKQEPKQEPKKAAEPAEPKQEPDKPAEPAEPKQEPDKPAEPVEPKQEPEKAPAWAVALEQSIKALTAAQQKANVKFDDMGEPQSVDQAALDALDKVYNGGKNK